MSADFAEVALPVASAMALPHLSAAAFSLTSAPVSLACSSRPGVESSVRRWACGPPCSLQGPLVSSRVSSVQRAHSHPVAIFRWPLRRPDRSGVPAPGSGALVVLGERLPRAPWQRGADEVKAVALGSYITYS